MGFFLKTFKIVFLCFFFLSSCVLRPTSGGSSAQVQVFVNPYGEEEEVQTGLATIRRQAGDRPCRPSSPDPRSIADTLEKYKLLENKESPIFDIFGINPEGDETSEATDSNRRRSEPLKIPVGENWLKIGLHIVNGNEEFFLIVTDIFFTAVARRGDQTWTHSGNISSGYCGTNQALYLVPPGKRVEYKPHSRNDILSNLTLYMDGFPIVDRRAQPSRRFRALAGEGKEGGGTGGETEDLFLPESCHVFIPSYDVEMTLSGHFITQEGNPVFEFSHRVSFSTQSLNSGC